SELVPPLRNVFSEQKENEQGHKAALLLADYLADTPQSLIELILKAHPRQLAELLPKNPESRPRYIDLIAEGLAQEKPTSAKQSALDQSAQHKANAAISLAALGREERMWPLLAHSEDPRLRSYLIERLPRFGFNASILIGQLRWEQNASIRQALLLCLGN